MFLDILTKGGILRTISFDADEWMEILFAPDGSIKRVGLFWEHYNPDPMARLKSLIEHGPRVAEQLGEILTTGDFVGGLGQ